MKRSHFIAALMIAASISSVVVIFQHNSSTLRCSLDGSRVEPLYEVTVIAKDKISFSFSCILSAQIWLSENSEPVSSIWVTDEMTGEKIRAELGYYVESNVITTPHTGNRIHVFAGEKVAKLHARQYDGKFVKNPFRVRQKRPVKLAEYVPYTPDCTGTIPPSTQKSLCLASNNVLILSPNYGHISQICFSQLPNGYSSPPEKPPKNLLLSPSDFQESFLSFGTKDTDFFRLV